MSIDLTPPERTLILSLGELMIGQLREQGNVWEFVYATSWLEADNAFDLAPSLPRQTDPLVDGGSKRPVQWFFDNLLPEEGARELQSKELDVDPSDAFGLLAALGAESAGAWTLRSPGQPMVPSGWQSLSKEQLSKRIKGMATVSLQDTAPKRMSLAGAQHKLAITVRGGQWLEPIGSAASTHILKPDHQDSGNYPHSAFNEYVCMRLARSAGLSIPDVAFHRVPESVYLVQRFDRSIDDDGLVQRLPVIDACQLLGLDRSAKYRSATPEAMKELANRCASPAVARRALLQWTVFNLLMGNGDAHLKNLSFRIGPSGVSLAPFYDLLNTAVYRTGTVFDRPEWNHAEVSLAITGLRVFGDVKPERLEQLSREFKLTPNAAMREAARMVPRIRHAAPELESEWESTQAEQAPTFGEQKLFRLIVKGLLKEQCDRLGL